MTSKELTWADWVSIGKAFKKMDAYLMNELASAKPKTGAKAKSLRRLHKRFGDVRSELDGLVCAKFQRKGTDAARVFYGEQLAT